MSEMMQLISDSRKHRLSEAQRNRLALLLAQDATERHLKGLKGSIRKRLDAPKHFPRLP